MHGIWMQFEVKLLLAFGVVLLVVLLFGSGSLSFEEAKSKAVVDRSSLSLAQLSKLEKFQAKFFTEALPLCFEKPAIVAGNFTLVIEVASNGQVARSWRQGDSDLMTCFQKLIIDNFFYVSIGKPFFTSFEYSHAF
jgi:hypothetical protein